MNLTKLDMYDVWVFPGRIRISLEGSNDARATDILSELSRSDNMIYFDSNYYQFLGNSEIMEENGTFNLWLDVVECDRREFA